MRSATLAWLLLAVSLATAAPPDEVPGSAVFGHDHRTLIWQPAAGATGYNVYRGTWPGSYDHTCRVYRTPATSAALDDEPGVTGGLVYFLVSAANADGEGPLGSASSGSPRPNGAPCADADDDLLPDNLDNCRVASNPSQADQDGNGVGDACDPNTYDFERDVVGARPAAMAQLGPSNASFTARDLAGDRGVAYDSSTGAFDRFENLFAGMPLQDTTVYLDFDAAPEVCSIELWSEGAYGWNAGGGVILQVSATGGLVFYDRLGQQVPSISGPAAPANGRLRLRLIKGEGTTSTLHVDSWDGAAWQPDYATFPVADDHRYRGLGTVLADYLNGRRGVKRVTVVHGPPPGALTLREDPSWSCDWKLFQRDSQDRAMIPVRFYYRLDSPGRAQARIARSTTGVVLPGHDWSDHEAALGAAEGASGSLDLAGVPTGGNYDIDVRLVRDEDSAVLGEGSILEIAVGDVFLAGGQSNMSGYSGSLAGAEAPVDGVHLLHNDYTWKRASEPMDDGTDQVDRVSYEMPQHTLMLRFAKEIYQATGVPVAIIPGPLGGTNLYGQWQRNASDHDDRGTLYGSLLHRALVQGYGAPVRGFLWYQGESDAGRGTSLYKADLERLVAQYREDLDAPDLFFGIVQLATYEQANLVTWLSIQEAQRQVVEEDPLSVLSAAVDLPRADAIHLNVEGYKTIGARLAAETREHLYGQAIDASARLVGARAAGNGDAVELLYDADVTGGIAGLFQVWDSSGQRKVTSFDVLGSTITLGIQGRLKSDARISYGYSRSPTSPWVKDSHGTAVACFKDVPIAP